MIAATLSLACAQLMGLQIPASAIALPTRGATVTSAEVVAASGAAPKATGEYCLVSAKISPADPAAPDIQFRVALPMAWNSKVLMFGGGGFNGSIPNVAGDVPNGPPDQPNPLGRGYATFGSDSGHQANALASQDGSFALNDEAANNFAGDAIKKTRDAATFIVKKRYGVKAIRKAYFAGGSTGGREAIAAITRWPQDWDGAIAWYPAWNDVSALLQGQRISRALSQPGAYPNQAKRELLFKAAVKACDALDGVEDGLISNQSACNAKFDPATLRCPDGGEGGDACLSDAQLAALKVMDTDARFNFKLASGETHYPGTNVWGADLGMAKPGVQLQNIVTFLALGWSAPAAPMPRTGPYIGPLLDQWVKYSVARDANFDSLSLDPESPGAFGPRISELSVKLDTPVDLKVFAAKGGKLLMVHGVNDILVSTRATEEYYERLQSQMGAARVHRFARYYEVPGFGHGASTVFNASWDSLTALENWAEKKAEPKSPVVLDTVGVPGRTRPLCDYPQWPQYAGQGDQNQASAFRCVTR